MYAPSYQTIHLRVVFSHRRFPRCPVLCPVCQILQPHTTPLQHIRSPSTDPSYGIGLHRHCGEYRLPRIYLDHRAVKAMPDPVELRLHLRITASRPSICKIPRSIKASTVNSRLIASIASTSPPPPKVSQRVHRSGV